MKKHIALTIALSLCFLSVCGCTDKPEGKIYMGRPNIGGDNEEIRQFIEICFDPKTKMSVKLKDTLYRMMAGEEK